MLFSSLYVATTTGQEDTWDRVTPVDGPVKASVEEMDWKKINTEQIDDHSPGGVFALGGSAEHRNVGHDNYVILRAHRLLLAEHVHALGIEAERSIWILNNILLGPGLAAID